ncbi:MAG: hypothetical protein M0P70_17960 [Desulfobulbaceae bacterium]|nr:hypothetical protein [Desulfobulbaceae bacterium]
MIGGAGQAGHDLCEKFSVEGHQDDLFIAVTDSDEVNLIACILSKQYNVASRIGPPKQYGIYTPMPYVLMFSSFLAPFGFRSQNQRCSLNSKGVFLKYRSIAFVILPSAAGGLAW